MQCIGLPRVLFGRLRVPHTSAKKLSTSLVPTTAEAGLPALTKPVLKSPELVYDTPSPDFNPGKLPARVYFSSVMTVFCALSLPFFSEFLLAQVVLGVTGLCCASQFLDARQTVPRVAARVRFLVDEREEAERQCLQTGACSENSDSIVLDYTHVELWVFEPPLPLRNDRFRVLRIPLSEVQWLGYTRPSGEPRRWTHLQATGVPWPYTLAVATDSDVEQALPMLRRANPDFQTALIQWRFPLVPKRLFDESPEPSWEPPPSSQQREHPEPEPDHMPSQSSASAAFS
eukprot:RCo014315